MSDTLRVDPHVKVLNDRVTDRAKARGIDVLVYAPHFRRLPRIRREAAAHSDESLLVVPGRELFTGGWRERKHVLALGLDEPVPDFLTLPGTMAELDRQDATVLAPHPEFLTFSLDESDLRTYRRLIDAVEIYNPKHWPRHNRRARDVATALDCPPFCSSYAHLPSTVGIAWVEFDGVAREEAAVLDAVRRGAPRRLCHGNGPRHRLQCVAEFAHVFWENSWKKLDRVFLSGTEPTHPAHIAYDGRFDDVAVYHGDAGRRRSA